MLSRLEGEINSTQIIYAGRDLRVELSSRSTANIYVTFTHLSEVPFQAGFGEKFFSHKGISTLAFISLRNHWWQTEEMSSALSEASIALSGFARRIFYGSSMGAFGAMMFGDILGADLVLAMSPQYSIDPKVVPFETRYGRYLENIRRYIYSFSEQNASNVPTVLFYESAGLDKIHQDLFPQSNAISRFPVPFGGHPLLLMMQEMCLLKPLLLEALDRPPDLNFLAKAIRERRSSSAAYHRNMARYAKRSGKVRLLERTCLKLLRLAPDDIEAYQLLSYTMQRQRRIDEAVAAAEKVCRLAPNLPHDRRHLGSLLMSQGRMPEAMAHFAQLMLDLPDLLPPKVEMARCLGRLGEMAAAEAMILSCLERAPQDKHALAVSAELAVYKEKFSRH